MGVLYSVNYDYRPIERLSFRAGVSIFPVPSFGRGDSTLALLVPIAVTGLFGGREHFFEFGAGYDFIWYGEEMSHAFVPNAGYRYQPRDGGFLFRATVTPLYVGHDALYWFGLSFGGTWGG